MAGSLAEIKSVRVQDDRERSESPLVALKSIHTSHSSTERIERPKDAGRPTKEQHFESSPQGWLSLLRSQPNLEDVLATLRLIAPGESSSGTFRIDIPGPLQAQIVGALVTTVVADFWPSFTAREKDVLAACLRNIPGINALVARIRRLSSTLSESNENFSADVLQNLIDLTELVVSGSETITRIWSRLDASELDQVNRKLLWKEASTLFASGKLIAVIAQAEDAIKSTTSFQKASWLANGAQYSAWLGRNISQLASLTGCLECSAHSDAAMLLSKSLHIGYPFAFFRSLFQTLVLRDRNLQRNDLASLLQALPRHANRTFTENLLRWLSSLTEMPHTKLGSRDVTREVRATSAFLRHITSDNVEQQRGMDAYFLSPSTGSITSFATRRALYRGSFFARRL